MKKLLLTTLQVAAMAMFTGCTTVYRVSESSEGMSPAQAKRPAMRPPIVSVKAAPDDKNATQLAASLKASVEGGLAAKGFEVKAKGKPDSTVELAVSRRYMATLAQWRVSEGKVTVRVTNAATGALVANKTLVAKSERALDNVKADDSLVAVLAPQLSKLLEKTLPMRKIPLPPPPLAEPRAMAMVTIRPADPAEDPADVLVVQRRFMDSVASHPGILSCVLAREEPANRAFVFRVEYEPQSFPGGLLNTIVLDRPRLGGGVVLEIVR